MTGEHGDLRAYIRVLWRWKFLILAFVVLIPLAAYAYASSKPKVYQSGVLLQVQALAVDTSLFGTEPPAPQAQTLLSAARLVTTTAVARAAAQELGEPASTSRSLLADVTATADVQADFITVTARAPTGRRAAAVANAFAAAVVKNRTDQAVGRLNVTIGKVEQQLAQITGDTTTARDGRKQLSEQLQRLRALRAAQGNNAHIVEPAIASTTPVAPRVTRTVILAGIVALLLAFGAVVLAQGSDRKIRDPSELEELTGRPLLSAVPRSAFGDEPNDGAAEEAFQTLRASLTYFNVDREIKSVLVTSPAQGDGKTTVATNLARAMARAGKDVILVDADLRRPQVAWRFHVPGVAGLGGVLVGETGLQQAFVEPEADTLAGRLRILPAGPPPPNPSELLASQRMTRLLEKLAEACDLVIVDSTPLLTVSDSLPLVEVVSGVVVVARVNETSKDALKRLQSVIASAGGTLLGAVATGTAATALYGGYGYGYRQDAAANGAGGRQATSSRAPRAASPPTEPAKGLARLRKGAEEKVRTPSVSGLPEKPPERKKNGRFS
ncbi:MAG: tyrosine-protein kinase [Solirubrobacteraceae bacterium]|nr:tyrosine-protein kinase [Solirubrobacteraceae bacterium]